MTTRIDIKEQLTTLQASLLDGNDPSQAIAASFSAINSQESVRPLNLKEATRLVPDEDKTEARAGLSRQLSKDRIRARIMPRARSGNTTLRGKTFQPPDKGQEKLLPLPLFAVGGEIFLGKCGCLRNKHAARIYNSTF